MLTLFLPALTLSALLTLPAYPSDFAGTFSCRPVQEASDTKQTPAYTKPEPKEDLFKPGKWKELFDGKSLKDWKQTNFSGGGEVRVEKKFRDGPAAILVDAGVALSGFNWTGAAPPKTNYEITLEAMKIDGSDFMCGLTFPVGDSHASLILGGWGGGVVGISSLDGKDASENETTKYMGFAKDRWYKVRLRVTPEKLEAWLDDKQVVNQEITGKKISLRRGEIDKSTPIGFSTYQTSAAYRAIKLRRLPEK